MQIILIPIVLGTIILIVLLWYLSAWLERMLFGAKKDKTETTIEPFVEDKDETSERAKSGWLENFTQWAGPRLPADAKRVGITILWLIVLLSLFDHLHSRSGFTGNLTYFLVILPHEAGHFLCSPFGWFLTVAGGSIWQVLLFLLFGVVAILRRHRNEALGWWTIAGHSLINLSTYIADASTRSLHLIPIPDPARHDWGNMLEYLGLLQYDWLFAEIAIAIGGGIVLSVVVAGIFFTWYQPQKLFK